MTDDQLFQAIWAAIAKWSLTVITAGGGAALIAYKVFRQFGTKWLDQHFNKRLDELKHEQQKNLEELKHEKQQQIELLKHEISSLFSRISKVHEKEFAILPEAWRLLQQAHGAVFKAASALKQYPDFSKMTEPQFEDFVASCPLADYEKKELRDATDRLEYYRKQITWVDIRKAAQARTDFNNFLAVNSIFLGEGLRGPFQKINGSLGRLIISQEIGNQGFPEMFKENAKELDEISGTFDQIEKAVQKRLRFEEA